MDAINRIFSTNVKFKNDSSPDDAKKKLKKIVGFFEARLAVPPLTKIHNNLNPLRITQARTLLSL